ncbi:hypothetical protein FNV43_RR26379 [Rhamnella rubrinervis]|uniref:Uncharacterized protein n=1 Tax=Rhamnella rubrinervis TaxID=2594499 RepID=A0A8K0DMG4_9ROSA|nr:hypothetical protein FNV43_RR26379 [Rhamnella rubrinervis]
MSTTTDNIQVRANTYNNDFFSFISFTSHDETDREENHVNHYPPPHILVFPYPAQGHSLALVDLTHQLSLRNVSVTILVTPKNLHELHQLLSNHPTIQTLVLPFPHHPKLSPGVENVKDIGNQGNCIGRIPTEQGREAEDGGMSGATVEDHGTAGGSYHYVVRRRLGSDVRAGRRLGSDGSEQFPLARMWPISSNLASNTMPSERVNLASKIVAPERQEEEITPIQKDVAGPSFTGGGPSMADERVDQLLARMEECRSEARTGKRAARRGWSLGKKTRAEDGDHSRRTTRSQRGKEPSEDLDSTDEYTPAKERTAKPYHPRKTNHYHTLREDRASREDLAGGENGDWLGDGRDRLWAKSRGSIPGFSPKVHCMRWHSRPRDHIIHFKQAMIPTCMPQPKRDAVMCKAQTFVVLEEETALDVQRAVKEGRIAPVGGEEYRADSTVRARDNRFTEYPRGQRDGRVGKEKWGPTKGREESHGRTTCPAGRTMWRVEESFTPFMAEPACGGERREDRRAYARIPIAIDRASEDPDIVFTEDT